MIPPLLCRVTVVYVQCSRVLGVGGLTENYRGHSIRITRTRFWDAIIIEDETGIVLPTKATAHLNEGRAVLVARARELIDLYMGERPLESWQRRDVQILSFSATSRLPSART